MEIIKNNIVQVLIRLDNEARIPNIEAAEFSRRGQAITKILEKIETDFGEEFMWQMFAITNKKLGHSLGPLDLSFVKRLMKLGYVIKINKVSEYEK